MANFLLVPVSICFALFVQSSLSLVCSNCNLDCSDPVDEQCLDPGESQTVACLTETFTDFNNKTGHQRKCVIFQDDIDKFECVQQPTYQTVSCMTCSTDLCNRAAALPPSFSSATATNGTRSNNTEGTPNRLYYNVTRPYPLNFDRHRGDDGDNNNIQQELEKDKIRAMPF